MDTASICFVLGIIIALISGIVQMLKISFNIPTRVIPIVSCVVGVLVGLALQPFVVYSHYTMSVVGFILGLSSSGLFDITKVFKKKD